MERRLKRISDELKLPRESRERIRSQLASRQGKTEEIPMKKSILKSRTLLIAAVMAMVLTLTAAAVVVRLYRNDIIVPSAEDIPALSSENGTVAVSGPNGTPPATLEEITKSRRFKSDDWDSDGTINDGVMVEYHQWDSAEVLSSDPALRSRRVTRTADGAEKMEYTAENPASLLNTLTDRVTFDLEWLNEQYDYVPDANFSFVVSDAEGGYVSEAFDALYARKDGSGYVDLAVSYIAQADYFIQPYVVADSYETAYYYTSADGHEYLIEMNTGNVWVQCRTSHADVSLYGAYLTTDEVEDILDHLSLTINA